MLEEVEAGVLAYLDFPCGHHVRLRTNNVQERANRELKRRNRVVQFFPIRKSLIRMMGAVFSEMDEDWAGRRWFSDESMGRARGGREGERTRARLRGHRRRACGQDHRARRGRQPDSRQEGGVTWARMPSFIHDTTDWPIRVWSS